MKTGWRMERDSMPCLRTGMVSLLVIGGLLMMATAFAGESAKEGARDTLLMFVGEELEVISIATRREEGAWQAPAVARVITRQEMLSKGFQTVGEAISSTPGYHIGEKEWGGVPYVRGIPNALLLLYDTSPIGSDVTKTLNPLGEELSLSAVKRIEIIRGPASVLWGPDAFAGTVNIVPLSGRDVNGIQTGLSYQGPGDQTGAFVNAGRLAGDWDLFCSVNGQSGPDDTDKINVTRFWADEYTPVPPEERYAAGRAGDNRFLEAVGRVSHDEDLQLITRISSYEKEYAVTDGSGRYTFGETRRVDSGLVRLETKRNLGLSTNLRFSGSYSWIEMDTETIDREISQSESSRFAELILDRGVFAGSGLLTAGISYRQKDISDAPVWDGYLPDFLGPDNIFFVPGLTLRDYDTELNSVFAQYMLRFGKWVAVAGARYDDHDAYEDKATYNFGVTWNPLDDWTVKAMLGTAYRTPFSKQLREGGDPELEMIRNVSLQCLWKPTPSFQTSLCLFSNRIDNHVMEDPYAGLSLPNHQNIEGMELDLNWRVSSRFELSGNLTVMESKGPDETYLYNDYSIVLPDGSVEKHFVDLHYAYDSGPETLANLMAVWRPVHWVDASLRFRYFGSQELSHPRGEKRQKFDGQIVGDAAISLKTDRFYPGSCRLVVNNLLDADYALPGTYNAMSAEPLTVKLIFQLDW